MNKQKRSQQRQGNQKRGNDKTKRVAIHKKGITKQYTTKPNKQTNARTVHGMENMLTERTQRT